MPSFDIVSEVEMNEAQNAVDNANRELDTRFDFRGVDASIELNDKTIKLKAEAEADAQVMQLFDILANKVSKRGMDVSSLELQEISRAGKNVFRNVALKQGIEKDVAKKVVKAIKDSKVKVQAAIQGEEVRVTGKKRDDLQEAMQVVRGADLGQPFQFKNFRD
ncbi:YajQ family cyclic di-GMP-binding protein [Pseudoalteromonas sp.]|uniref:YajQ family cyclic di-GMP-binding protein n=1 Tax=Pseudoalteromonas sp. TaxID=53249 RepID=UPI003F95D141